MHSCIEPAQTLSLALPAASLFAFRPVRLRTLLSRYGESSSVAVSFQSSSVYSFPFLGPLLDAIAVHTITRWKSVGSDSALRRWHTA